MIAGKRTSEAKFPFHLIFIMEFSIFSVVWFAFWKFNNFRIFWNFGAICPRFGIFWLSGSAPSTQNVRKFRLERQWNTTFWFVPLQENFRKRKNLLKGSPVFPVVNFPDGNLFHLLSQAFHGHFRSQAPSAGLQTIPDNL